MSHPMNAVLSLEGFAPLGRFVTSQTRHEVFTTEWRGAEPLYVGTRLGDLGMGTMPLGFWFDYAEFQGMGWNGQRWQRAEKLLTDIQGPKPPSPKGGLPVLRFEAVKIFQAPALDVAPSLFPKVGPGLGSAWAEAGESLPLWRKFAEEGAKLRLGAVRESDVPKEVRLVLAACPASTGTEPRAMLAWVKGEMARRRTERKAGSATKKGASRTGLGGCTSSQPGALSLGEMKVASRYLAGLIRSCRLTLRDRERTAKAKAKARQAEVEKGWQALWGAALTSEVGGKDSPLRQRVPGQTSAGRVYLARGAREKVYA